MMTVVHGWRRPSRLGVESRRLPSVNAPIGASLQEYGHVTTIHTVVSQSMDVYVSINEFVDTTTFLRCRLHICTFLGFQDLSRTQRAVIQVNQHQEQLECTYPQDIADILSGPVALLTSIMRNLLDLFLTYNDTRHFSHSKVVSK